MIKHYNELLFTQELSKEETKPIKFKKFFKVACTRFNQAYVMQAVCLSDYFHIYKDIPKDLYSEDDLKHTYGNYNEINGYDINHILGGKDFPGISNGYTDFSFNFINNFYQYKLAIKYPHIKMAACRHPDKMKKNLIDSFNKIITDITHNNLTQEQKKIVQHYNDYVSFNVKHMLSYLAQFDNDFAIVGKALFKDFGEVQKLKKVEIFNIIEKILNQTLNSYYEKKENFETIYQKTFTQDIILEDKTLENLFDYLQGNKKLDSNIIKESLTSHEKGKLGEQLFGNIINAQVIGFKNNKVDIEDQSGAAISLKTSYSHIWNNHLSYLNNHNEDHCLLIDSIHEKIPLFKIKNLDWYQLIKSFICGNEDIQELTFQKITMDEFNEKPIDIKLWRIDVDQILDLVKSKQFIFQNNNIIIFHEQEQLFKINIKKRTDKIQVMICTEENLLNHASENGLGTFANPLRMQNDTICKITKM